MCRAIRWSHGYLGHRGLSLASHWVLRRPPDPVESGVSMKGVPGSACGRCTTGGRFDFAAATIWTGHKSCFCMPRFVIDANIADSLELATWLAKSPGNTALITTAFAIEAYRRRKIEGIKKSYGVLSRYPRQLRVVKNLDELCRLHVRSKGMSGRMLDDSGTKDLLNLCRGLGTRSQSAIESGLAPLIRQADEQVRKLEHNSHGLGSEIAAHLSQLSTGDLLMLRKGEPYTSALIRDLLDQVVGTTALVMPSVPGCYAPKDRFELIRSFPCRLVLCGALAMRERARRGDVAVANPSHLRNDLLDAQYVAVALYFDGLLTNDMAMRALHLEARAIVALLQS